MKAAKRKSLRKTQFGLPGRRAYPTDTRKRAAVAKGRATAAFNRGQLSQSAMERIRAKANKRLARK